MGDVDKLTHFDLMPSLGQPASKRCLIQFRMVLQRYCKKVQDELEEVRLVSGIPSIDRVHHPVRSPGGHDLSPSLLQMPEQMPPRRLSPPLGRVSIVSWYSRSILASNSGSMTGSSEVTPSKLTVSQARFLVSENSFGRLSGMGSRSRKACAMSRSAGSGFCPIKSNTSACTSLHAQVALTVENP